MNKNWNYTSQVIIFKFTYCLYISLLVIHDNKNKLRKKCIILRVTTLSQRSGNKSISRETKYGSKSSASLFKRFLSCRLLNRERDKKNMR